MRRRIAAGAFALMMVMVVLGGMCRVGATEEPTVELSAALVKNVVLDAAATTAVLTDEGLSVQRFAILAEDNDSNDLLSRIDWSNLSALLLLLAGPLLGVSLLTWFFIATGHEYYVVRREDRVVRRAVTKRDVRRLEVILKRGDKSSRLAAIEALATIEPFPDDASVAKTLAALISDSNPEIAACAIRLGAKFPDDRNVVRAVENAIRGSQEQEVARRAALGLIETGILTGFDAESLAAWAASRVAELAEEPEKVSVWEEYWVPYYTDGTPVDLGGYIDVPNPMAQERAWLEGLLAVAERLKSGR